MLSACLVGLLAASACPVEASAFEPVTLDDLAEAEAAALAYWGGPTAQQCPTGIHRVIVPKGSLGDTIVARAQMPWPSVPGSGCLWWLDESYVGADHAYSEVCLLVIHEYGHLNGHDHTPGTVMDALLGESTSGPPTLMVPPPECVRDPSPQWAIEKSVRMFERSLRLERRCDRVNRSRKRAATRSVTARRRWAAWRECERSVDQLERKMERFEERYLS